MRIIAIIALGATLGERTAIVRADLAAERTVFDDFDDFFTADRAFLMPFFVGRLRADLADRDARLTDDLLMGSI